MASDWYGILRINSIDAQVTATKTQNSWRGSGKLLTDNLEIMNELQNHNAPYETQIGSIVINKFSLDPMTLKITFTFLGTGEPRF